MKLKIFFMLGMLIFFHLHSGTIESQLHYYFVRNPDPIVIPHDIDFKSFSTSCKVELAYEGDWIGGWSLKKSCFIYYDYLYNVQIIYQGLNDQKLFEITVPDSYTSINKSPYSRTMISDGTGNFLFREDRVYSFDIALFSPVLFEFNELKELIKTKKIQKIKLIIKDGNVKAEAHCTGKDSESEVENKEVKLKFNLDKTFIIGVRYD